MKIIGILVMVTFLLMSCAHSPQRVPEPEEYTLECEKCGVEFKSYFASRRFCDQCEPLENPLWWHKHEKPSKFDEFMSSLPEHWWGYFIIVPLLVLAMFIPWE